MMERMTVMEADKERYVLFGLPREQQEMAEPEALGGAVIAAQEREMAEVARCLHEDTAQHLARALAELEIISQEAGVEPEVRGSIASTSAYIDEALKGVLDLSSSLRPAVIDRLGLAAALRSLTGRMNGAYPVAFRLVAVGREGEIPEEIKLGLYRIAQEALREIAECSDAREVLVCLNRSYGGIGLVISDDRGGRGGPLTHGDKAWSGAASMRERAESIGGSFERCSDHRGVTLRVHVPLVRYGS